MKGGLPYIRLEGDKDKAESLLRRARAELQRTKDVAARMGVSDYQRMVKVDEDSYIITKIYRGDIEIVNIYAAPYVPGKLVEKEPEGSVEEPTKMYSIYSGLVYNGWIPEVVDPETGEETYPDLHNFNPTEWCRRTNPGDFDPDLNYQDVSRLSITKAYSYLPTQQFDWYGRQMGYPPGGAKVSQYNSVRPCCYTGLMAVAVSAIMGYGNFNTQADEEYENILPSYYDPAYLTAVKANGFQILYDYRFSRSHHITKGSTGELWLVEISVINGIIAMPLKYLNMSLFSTDPDVDWPISVINDKLKGLPSGETFPQNRSEVIVGIANKEILELMSPTEYDEIMGEWREYAENNSWAMNEDGTEGRVTAYRHYNGDVNFRECGYLQISIEISGSATTASGSANIVNLKEPTLLVSGFRKSITTYPTLSYIYQYGVNDRGMASDVLVDFYQAELDGYTSLNITTTSEKCEEIDDQIPDESSAVVWVGYIDGKWEEVTFYTKKYTDCESQYFNIRTPTPEIAPHNIGIPVATNGATGSSGGVKQWNSQGKDIIHHAHVTSTSNTGYSKSNYTKQHVGLRWNNLVSWTMQSQEVQIVPGFIGGYGILKSSLTYENVPCRPDDSIVATSKGRGLTTAYYWQAEYEGVWFEDFPEFNTRIKIAPLNRSAYFFYEEEYMPRKYGPAASVAGNGGDWAYPTYINDVDPPGQYGAYYSINYTAVGAGRQATAGKMVGKKVRWMYEEIPPATNGGISYPGSERSPAPNPFRSRKHGWLSNVPSPLPTYVDHNTPYYDIQQSADANGKVTWHSPGRYKFLTWCRIDRPQFSHPNDVRVGTIGACADWHQRMTHFTTESGYDIFGNWNEHKIWLEGIAASWWETPNEAIDIGEGDWTVGYCWGDLTSNTAPGEDCTERNDLINYTTQVTHPTTPDETWVGAFDLLERADAYHWNVVTSITYNEHFSPYIKSKTWLLCDRVGRIDFQDKDLVSSSKIPVPLTIPPNDPPLVNYDYRNDTKGIMTDDQKIEDEKTHKTTHSIFHCQHAVVGEPAAIYSNLDTINPVRGLGYSDCTSVGTLPELPDTGGDDERFKLITFIGVNSE